MTVEPARSVEPNPSGRRLTPVTAGSLLFVAVCIVSARVGASGLPAPFEVSRPNLEGAVVFALGAAVVGWLLAVFALLRVRSAWWLRLAFALIAAVEVLAWLAALDYYRHWEKLYNGGNFG